MSDKQPLMIAYGGGLNSTAMLIQMAKLGIIPDAILFADTGGEWPDVYEFVPVFSQWLQDRGMPKIISARAARKDATLYDECMRKETLPSLAFGFKKCSLGWKVQPQDKWTNNWEKAKECWKSGGKVIKAIGYDADEMHRRSIPEDDKYEYIYPLRDWGWGRAECERCVELAGLVAPVKSACFFCPAAKKEEVLRIARNQPNAYERALAMERNAKNLSVVKGLGRHWSWSDVVNADAAQLRLFPDPIDKCERGCFT